MIKIRDVTKPVTVTKVVTPKVCPTCGRALPANLSPAERQRRSRARRKAKKS